MKYMGSKDKIAKEIIAIILTTAGNRSNISSNYYEPFAGGMNLIDKLWIFKRHANDINKYLIALFKAVVYNNYQPRPITPEIYNKVKNNKDAYPDHVVGWVAFGCSYSGKYFGGYAGETKTEDGKIRSYQLESIKSLRVQKQLLQGVIFSTGSYLDMVFEPNSIIYCDIPYKSTTGYGVDFDHDQFYKWAIQKHSEGHLIFVSEYDMPHPFRCIWYKSVKSSLSANGESGGNKISFEKLFTI